MKWLVIIFFALLVPCNTYAEEPENLYAQSAVLMDAESGRVLFGKNEDEQKAMASTTKIMTCILALEYGKLEDVAEFSKEAASQPEVHLGAKSGTRFYLEDLLYSLMLESHNDTAVAIAEHISGSVEAFAGLMNQKAAELGCERTHYVTPNGLDGRDSYGNHVTTARELARIMTYCIKESEMSEVFLKITQTRSYTFMDVEGNKTYTCTNHNAFLDMMEGAVSGKTGYTAKAGYCYVGALEHDGRTFVVSLLACGWPNHKNYKWSDTKTLMSYGIENYRYFNVLKEIELPKVKVENGIEVGELYEDASVSLEIQEEETESLWVLKREDEQVEIDIRYKEQLTAPVKAGTQVGEVVYYLEDEVLKNYPIIVRENIKQKNVIWYLTEITRLYFMKSW